MKTLKAILCCILFFTLLGCSSDDEPISPKEDNTIEIDNKYLNITHESADVGEISAQFSAKGIWTAETSAGWLDISPKSGNTGTINLKINITEQNELYEDRNAQIKIKSGGVVKTITVTQKKKEAIIADRDKVELDNTATGFSIKVKSNVAYEIVIDEASEGWIKHQAAKVKNGLTEYTENFIITEPVEYDKRQGKITFRSGNISEDVMVYQAERRALVLTKNIINLSNVGSSAYEVEVKTNIDYDVIIPQDAQPWISLTTPPARGIRTDRFFLKIEPNSSGADRSSQIVVKDKYSDLSETLTVNQNWIDRLVIGSRTIEAAVNGGSYEVELQSNIDYDIVMPEGIGWIREAPKSKAMVDYKHTFIIDKYDDPYYREVDIIFASKTSSYAKDTVTFFQNSGRNGIYTAEDLIELGEEWNKPLAIPKDEKILKKYGIFNADINKWVFEQKADIDMNPDMVIEIDESNPDDVKISTRGEIKHNSNKIGSFLRAFTDIYNGNNFKIKNYYSNSTNVTRGGLFGCLWGAQVNDVNIDGVIFMNVNSGWTCVGAIAGDIISSAINNCSANVHIYCDSKDQTEIGGLIGKESQTSYITNSGTKAPVIVAKGKGMSVGGVLGQDYYVNEKTSGFKSNARIYVYDFLDFNSNYSVPSVGGIVGFAADNILTDCEFGGSIYFKTITAKSNNSRLFLGGITGRSAGLDGIIESSVVHQGVTITAKGRISAKIGGVVGEAKIVAGCENYATLDVVDEYGTTVVAGILPAPEIIIASANHGTINGSGILKAELNTTKGIVGCYNVGTCSQAAISSSSWGLDRFYNTYWLEGTATVGAGYSYEEDKLDPSYKKTESEMKSQTVVDGLNAAINKWNTDNPDKTYKYEFYQVPGDYPKVRKK
jgi:hypothetical protein